MATKIAIPQGFTPGGMHTAGIFSDMTVDGPEIGTLVLVIDRAKNLPNRKTMGKQNPYCAARLGKEAKKTETDKRGGQTPKWDQELRFTVHESPDYNNLKVSVFSEDKRTDLIGEAWLGLTDVVVPGGGKMDVWQSLNYKGKYAGEIRIELTYYDSRPKPEKSVDHNLEHHSLSTSDNSTRMKRRALPFNPNSAPSDSVNGSLAAPVRAKHGPRDYRAPARAMSMPPETTTPSQARPDKQNDPAMTQVQRQESNPRVTSDPSLHEHHPQQDLPRTSQQYEDQYQTPDFLPRLPPSIRQRAPVPHASARTEQSTSSQPRPYSHIGLSHSHSAPITPILQSEEPETYEGGQHQYYSHYTEPIRDLEYQYQMVQPRRNSASPIWEQHYSGAYVDQRRELEEEEAAPPPPPLHSYSSPAIPQQLDSGYDYHRSFPLTNHRQDQMDDRRHHASLPSPSQGVEHGYQSPSVMHNERDWSRDDHRYSQDYGGHGSVPQSLIPGQQSSPHIRTSTTRSMQSATRQSVPDAYYNAPSRPHPLSQELPRSRSPQPYVELPGSSPQSYGDPYDVESQAPIVKPRAISPRPAQPVPRPQQQSEHRPKNSYSIQFPVRAFESSDKSPLSTAQRPAQPTHQPSVARKSVSPRPSMNTVTSTPYGPDSFDVHNPNARPSTLPSSNSPHSPYQISPNAMHQDDARGPIVGWHGQEIDPSDHLPVDSWAPEPEKKTPTKTYGLGRDRDFGPRSTQGVGTTNGRISKDTVVNVRMGSSMNEAEHSSSNRNRLTKKNSPIASRSPVDMVRNNHSFSSIPDPYAQPELTLDRERGYGRSANGRPPSLPPKVSMDDDQYAGNQDSLQRELASIDIGSSSSRHQRGGSVPAPTAFVPVRSHRDRMSYY